MIITRTPFRVSFAGGGSDIKDYYEKYSGAVVSSSINKYIYLSMHPNFNKNQYLLKYLNTEITENIEDIKHPVIKNVFKRYNIKGIDFNSSADIPAGTGLASSSAFTAGLITLCSAYTNKKITKEETAETACEIEIEDLKAPIGKQDQYECTFGGFNYIKFETTGMVSIESLNLDEKTYKALEKNLLLFYTGSARNSYSILAEQKKNTAESGSKVYNVHKMVQLAQTLKKELQNGNISAIGAVLNESWQYKKELARGISNAEIDSIYETALNSGAEGGKLLGAGGGGFVLFYAEEKNHQKIRSALNKLQEISFNFEFDGAKVIYKD